jgi:hypothetical protein
MSSSLLVFIVLIFVGVVAAKGLAGATWRPFVFGLGLLIALSLFFLIARKADVDLSIAQFQTEHARVMTQAQQEARRAMKRAGDEQVRAMAQAQQETVRAMAQAKDEQARAMAQVQKETVQAMTPGGEEPAQAVTSQSEMRTIAGPPAPRPPKPAADSAKHHEPEIVFILAMALRDGWIERSLETRKPAPLDARATAKPPAWIKAPAKLEGDVYMMSRQIGPYTTPLECERELPKSLRAAAAEYAELLLGRDQAGDVDLSDDVLKGLVRDRWIEHLAQEFGGAEQDMVILHVLIGFDRRAQDVIRAASEHVLVGRRMLSAGAALGGVLGLLALAWCGLGIFAGRHELKPSPVPAKTARVGWTVAGLAAALLALWVAWRFML